MQLLNHISAQSDGSLTLENVENIGGHYTRTLRLWRESFLLTFENKIRPALLHDHPEMSESAVEMFRKKWEVCRVPFLQSDSLLTLCHTSTTLLTVKLASRPRFWTMLSSPSAEQEPWSSWKVYRAELSSKCFYISRNQSDLGNSEMKDS